MRKGIDNIMNASGGALLVFVDNFESYSYVFQGGFRLHSDFTPQKLYELAKMDGAIILNDDGSRILAANVHLVPDPTIPTSETGTRHRTAERLAKQLKKLVVAISRRRKTITVYYGKEKHTLGDVASLMTRVNQALNTYEKYRQNFDKLLFQLDILEIENRVTLKDVCEIFSRAILAMKIEEEVRRYLVELGVEGRLSQLMLDEMSEGLEETTELLIMDYYNTITNDFKPSEVLDRILELSEKEILGMLAIARTLNYDVSSSQQLSEIIVESRGFRVLRSSTRIPMSVAFNVVRTFGNITNLSKASHEMLKNVDGIGDTRASMIRRTLDNLVKRSSTNY